MTFSPSHPRPGRSSAGHGAPQASPMPPPALSWQSAPRPKRYAPHAATSQSPQPRPKDRPVRTRLLPGSTSCALAPPPTLDVSPHTAHAPLPPPPRVRTQPRGRDRGRIPASPHPPAPPLPAHPHGTGLRGIPKAHHRHQSPRPRHTHPRPLLRPRPRPRAGRVVAALNPQTALAAAKVGPGRALPRGPGPPAPQGVGGELLPPAGGGVDAAGRMGSHAG